MSARDLVFDDAHYANDTEGNVWRPEKERLRELVRAERGLSSDAFEEIDARIRRAMMLALSAHSPSYDCHHPSQTSKGAPRDIPFSTLLQSGAFVVAVVCFLSLVSWFTDHGPLIIVNPFVALLLLVMSPFIYMMGRAARS